MPFTNKETQKTMNAYKLADSGENAEFSASLATLALSAKSLNMQSNRLGKRNIRKAGELIKSIPNDPTVKAMIQLICHDPSQTIMF